MNHIVHIHTKSPPHKKIMFSNEIRLEPQAGLIYSTISSIYFGNCREIFARHSMLKTAENTVK